MHAVTPPLRICGACGSSLPRRAPSCEVCGESALSAREVRVDERVGTFARIVASFRCRSCGHTSALEGLDVDGTVTCEGCGLTQAYYPGVWSKAFEFVHGLVDLGRSPGHDADTLAGLANPFAESGETRAKFAYATHDIVTIEGVVRTASIELVASVGHPLCERCKTPVQVSPAGDKVETRCGQCGDVAHYGVPVSPVRIAPMPVAVVGGDSRTDGAEVRVEGDAGAIAIRCPSCSASLQATSHEAVLTCSYCRTLCRIPARTMKSLRIKGAPAAPFFVAFRGLSLMRERLREEARAAASARESARAIEAFPIVPPSQQVIAMRTLTTLVVLVLVGLFFAPQIVEILAR